MRQPNGCSTPAPKSSAAKQWIKEELAQTKEEPHSGDFACSIALTSSSSWFVFTFSVVYPLSISSIFTFSASSFFVSAFSCVSSQLR